MLNEITLKKAESKLVGPRMFSIKLVASLKVVISVKGLLRVSHKKKDPPKIKIRSVTNMIVKTSDIIEKVSAALKSPFTLLI